MHSPSSPMAGNTKTSSSGRLSASRRLRRTLANRPPPSPRWRTLWRSSQCRTQASIRSSVTFWIEAATVSRLAFLQMRAIASPISISPGNCVATSPSSPSRKVRAISPAIPGSRPAAPRDLAWERGPAVGRGPGELALVAQLGEPAQRGREAVGLADRVGGELLEQKAVVAEMAGQRSVLERADAVADIVADAVSGE